MGATQPRATLLRARPLSGSALVANPFGSAKVAIDSSKVTLDKRGAAPVELSCSGGLCKGELTLSRRYVRRYVGRQGGRRRKLTKVWTVVLGKVQFTITDGNGRRIWVNLSKEGLRAVKAAGRHGLVGLATATVGQGPSPRSPGGAR